MDTPLISVCVSYYNDSAFLKEHIESFLKQTYQNWELILLNHASTDNSREIARSFNDPRIKHIDYPINIGAMGGLLLKECLKLAKGKYIKFFSADDFLAPNGLEILVNHMEENPEKDFAFGNVAYVDKDSKAFGDTWFGCRPGFSLNYNEQEALKCFFDGLSIFPFAGQIMRRSSLNEDWMNNNYILLFDVNLWSSFLLNGKKLGLIDQVVANYRIHENQATSLNKREISAIRGRYEVEGFRKLWLSAPNIEIIKYLCSSSPYVSKMDSEKDIPFIVGEYFLRNCASITGYSILNDYFENVENIKYIYDKFGFSIGDLRKLCGPFEATKKVVFSNWRKEARQFGNSLSIKQLTYLLFFKIYKSITKPLSKRQNKRTQETKKEYSH